MIYFHKSVFEGNSALHLPDPPNLKSKGKKKKREREFKYMHQDGGGGSFAVFHMSKFAFITLGFVQRGKKNKELQV